MVETGYDWCRGVVGLVGDIIAGVWVYNGGLRVVCGYTRASTIAIRWVRIRLRLGGKGDVVLVGGGDI